MQGHVLDTAIELGLEPGDDEQTPAADPRAGRAGGAHRDARAGRARPRRTPRGLGQAGALDSARMLAGEIDNPTLETLLAADPSAHTAAHTAAATIG